MRLLLSAEAVAQRGPVRAFFADRARTPGDIDILVNNAGISMFGPTAEVEMAAYDKMFASNVRASLFLVGALTPGLVERGRGSIISLSSMAGGVGLAGGAAYGATKASLEAMTRAWPAEYSASGVRVSAVAPGPVYTPTPLGRRVHHRAGGRRRRCAAHRIPRSSRSSRPPARATSPARRSPATADVERSR